MPTKNSSARVRLNAKQKLALYQHYKENPNLTQTELGTWARMKFKLSKDPSQKVISRLTREPPSESDVKARPNIKTQRSVTSTELEVSLVEWIDSCKNLNPPVVSWVTIREKAEEIRQGILSRSEGQDNTKLIALKFSNGWVQRFINRNGFKRRRVRVKEAAIVLKK
ncbi:hypothetical protein THRCLA_20634 [Thraustotheca clavata]|uniref:HTH CENPB-type domain-containing protein n=1 Tax=Thraustotheca clavata TaxID=74557 RepID=A0A1W0A574_9STRA|nr:hypothetical protein THRCLA_20634 [Thraustotheca clavata]